MSKKLIGCIVCCVVLIWCFRIYDVNQDKPRIYQAKMTENIQKNGLNIEAIEAHLFSYQEFLDYFQVSEDVLEYVEKSSKLICVCLNVANTTGTDMEWDWVMEEITCGFETITWYSSIWPNIGNKLNIFKKSCLYSGNNQKIWFVSEVNNICFRYLTWENLECSDFFYTLSLEPEKIRIQLE